MMLMVAPSVAANSLTSSPSPWLSSSSLCQRALSSSSVRSTTAALASR